jgi:hypothetical protein
VARDKELKLEHGEASRTETMGWELDNKTIKKHFHFFFMSPSTLVLLPFFSA